jgi:hypothetical protein
MTGPRCGFVYWMSALFPEPPSRTSCSRAAIEDVIPRAAEQFVGTVAADEEPHAHGPRTKDLMFLCLLCWLTSRSDFPCRTDESGSWSYEHGVARCGGAGGWPMIGFAAHSADRMSGPSEASVGVTRGRACSARRSPAS